MEKKSREEIRKDLLKQETNDDFKGMVDELTEVKPSWFAYQYKDYQNGK